MPHPRHSPCYSQIIIFQVGAKLAIGQIFGNFHTGTSDYDRQDYFQILCCGRNIVVTILKLKCQKQKVHSEFGSTESLVKFLISALQIKLS